MSLNEFLSISFQKYHWNCDKQDKPKVPLVWIFSFFKLNFSQICWLDFLYRGLNRPLYTFRKSLNIKFLSLLFFWSSDCRQKARTATCNFYPESNHLTPEFSAEYPASRRLLTGLFRINSSGKILVLFISLDDCWTESESCCCLHNRFWWRCSFFSQFFWNWLLVTFDLVDEKYRRFAAPFVSIVSWICSITSVLFNMAPL